MSRILSLFVAMQILVATAFCENVEKGLNVDFYNKLRFDYAARKDFSGAWEPDISRTAIIEAFQKGDFEKSKKLGDAWLKKVPVDAEIYLVIALGRKSAADLAGYAAYMGNYYGLLSSITATGDGLSAKTAFRVISVSEEYFLLRDIGAKVKGQSLVGTCDKMVVEQNGKELTYYFDASIPIGAFQRQFEKK